MKKMMMLMVIMAAMLTAPAAKAGDWYADVFGGINDTDVLTFDTVIGKIETDFDTGAVFGLAVGYKLEKIRVEGELSWRDVSVSRHDLLGVGGLPGATGEATSTSLFLSRSLFRIRAPPEAEEARRKSVSRFR